MSCRNIPFGRHLVLTAVVFLWAASLSGDQGHGEYKPDELVCEMWPGYNVDSINAQYGTSFKGILYETDCYLLATQPGQNPESLAVIIRGRPDVLYCAPNYYLDAPEPFQRSQPFLDLQNSGSVESQLAATTIDLPTVLTLATGADVNVAVIDVGVGFTHPYFAAKSGNVVSGWDFVDDDSIANDEPGGIASGHGTFVAGIIRMVARASHIYAYRVLDTLGRGDGYTIAEAVLSAIDDSCRVINLSLGMVGRNEALDDALKYAHDLGITIVAAAGNDSTAADSLFPFPADQSYALAVAALDSVNIKADFSNYGGRIDLCAPGTRIYSPYLDTLYAWWDGTSFAAPFVSGLAALLYSIDPAMTSEQVDSIIREAAVDIDSLNPGFEGKLGHGVVDMVTALNSVLNFTCGDVNRSLTINVVDVIYLITYIFSGGPAPLPLTCGDVNCTSVVNIADVVYLIAYIFNSGPAPCSGCL